MPRARGRDRLEDRRHRLRLRLLETRPNRPPWPEDPPWWRRQQAARVLWRDPDFRAEALELAAAAGSLQRVRAAIGAMAEAPGQPRATIPMMEGRRPTCVFTVNGVTLYGYDAVITYEDGP